MKTGAAVLALLALVCVASATEGVATAGSHPVENVIKMLQGLSAQVEEEGKAEALTYQKFEKWCQDSEKTLAKAIAEEKSQISSLESDVASKEQLQATLEREIGELEKQLGDHNVAGLHAKETREAGQALYEKAQEDYSSTIAAIEEAIAELDSSRSPELLAFSKPKVQKALALLKAAEPDAQKRAGIAALLQQRPDLLAAGDQQAHVQSYGFKSDNVIEMLKELKAKFEDELQTATKEETNALNAYSLSKQARDAAVAAAEVSKDQKTRELSDAGSALAEYQETLKATQGDLEADTESLGNTQQVCRAKKQEWDERSEVREQELKAMAAAVAILSKATGVRTEAPRNPVPPPAPVEASASFLQKDDPQSKAINILLSAAHRTHSHALERLAQELSAHMREEPFEQVNNMIEKMIFHLMSEQTDEDNHKHWCDQELSKSTASKVNKELRTKELWLELESAEATVALLTREVEEAQHMIAQITAFVREATEIRQIGTHENEKAIKDAQDAQAAIIDATSVLEAFYKQSGKIEKAPWEFIQRGVTLPDEPATWDSSYTGVADPQNQPHGIIAVLQSTAAEFARMEADTKAQEVTDQKAYEAEMKSSAIEQARREKEIEVKSQEKGRLVDKISAYKKAHKEVSAELEAVEQYLKDLEPACVNGDSTYEDRKEARSTEIDALKQAQVTLRDAFKETHEDAALAAVKTAPKRKFLQVNRHRLL